MILTKKKLFSSVHVCLWNSLKCMHQSALPRKSRDSFIPTIGLEIHAQINAASKLFSGAPNMFMSPPNSLVSDFDASMPGTLPVLNKECVKKAISTALALNCKINKVSYFDRKHYFYADMPQGYQITQQRCPVAVDGYMYYPTLDGSAVKRVNIHQIQLEQDSGKSLHAVGQDSFIDLNRAGVGLMEIVTAPDLSSADDTLAFIKELYSLLKYIDTCQGKLAEGQFRVDVNISLKTNNGPMGTRAEVKNINGLKYIHAVVEYEIQRQSKILVDGGEVEQETRAFDMDEGITVSMRDKEVQQDYRFMPEPNLPPLHVYNDKDAHSNAINIDDLRRNLPKLTSELRQEMIESFKLSFSKANFLLEREMSNHFLSIMRRAPQLDADYVYDWFRVFMTLFLAENNWFAIEECPVTANELCDLLVLQHNNEINESTAKQAFKEAKETGKPPTQIVEENNWKMISDIALVTRLCTEAIAQFEKQGLFSRYEVDNPKSKRNKNILTKVMDHLRHETNNKIHTKVAKKVIVKLLGDKYRRTA